MRLGEVLYESGATLSHVYFPTTAIASLLYVLENGASAEIAVVGKEGIVGVSMFMGGKSTPSRAVAQSGGQGFRLNAESLEEEFNRAGPLLHLLLRYTQALITNRGLQPPPFFGSTIMSMAAAEPGPAAGR
jgi:CRP-like cAMP-binding protein